MRNYREAMISNVFMVELLRKAGIDMPEDCVLLHAYQDPGDFGKGVTRYVFESQELKNFVSWRYRVHGIWRRRNEAHLHWHRPRDEGAECHTGDSRLLQDHGAVRSR